MPHDVRLSPLPRRGPPGAVVGSFQSPKSSESCPAITWRGLFVASARFRGHTAPRAVSVPVARAKRRRLYMGATPVVTSLTTPGLRPYAPAVGSRSVPHRWTWSIGARAKNAMSRDIPDDRTQTCRSGQRQPDEVTCRRCASPRDSARNHVGDRHGVVDPSRVMHQGRQEDACRSRRAKLVDPLANCGSAGCH